MGFVVATKPTPRRRPAHAPTHAFQGDLRHFDEVDAALGAETFTAVIHFAGRKAVGESVKEPMLYYTHNIVGAVNLIEAMRKHGVKNVSEERREAARARRLARTKDATPLSPRSSSRPHAPCTATSNPRTSRLWSRTPSPPAPRMAAPN